MNGELDLAGVPAFSRIDEYFGLWAIEVTRFVAAFERAQAMDLPRHMTQSLAAPEKLPGRSDFARVAMEGDTRRMASPPPAPPAPPASPAGDMKIAVIDLVGTLMKQQGSMGESTSTVAARAQVRAAAADPRIGGIVLNIDSPGGTVAGAFDLAGEIVKANAQKPVYAFVEDLGASAAYLMAAGATKIFANHPTAIVGSIGTIASLVDSSAAAEKKGMKVKVYASGPLKGAGMPGTPITAEQDAYFQGMVNELQKNFDAAVMAGRGLDKKALAKVNTGGVFLASEAVKLGLIDGVQGWEETIAGLRAAITQPKQNIQPGAGGGQRMAADPPTHLTKEVAMGEPTPTAPAVTQEPKAASLKELKAALPDSNSEFREKCLESEMTLGQAKDAWIAEQSAQIKNLKVAASVPAKPTGVAPLGAGKPAAVAGGDFSALVSAKMHDHPRLDRRAAIAAVAKENPEAHAAYLATMPAATRRPQR